MTELPKTLIRTLAGRLPPLGPVVEGIRDLAPWPLGRPGGWPPRPLSTIAYFGYSVTGAGGETTSQEDIFEVSPLTGRVRRITDDRGATVFKSDRDPAWAPVRTRLAIHTASDVDPVSRLVIIDRSTGAVVDTLVEGHSPEWLDAGTILYLGAIDPGSDTMRHDVFCVDVATRATTRLTDVGVGAEIGSYAWHPTAGLAVSVISQSAYASTVAVIPAAAVGTARAPGGVPVPRAAFALVPTADTHAVVSAWSPAADRLALTTTTAGGSPRAAQLRVADGTVTLLPGPGDPSLGDYGPVYSPDGRTIAFCRGYEDEWSEIWLCMLAPGRPRVRRLTNDHHGQFKGSLDW